MMGQGGALYYSLGDMEVTNSILWGDSAASTGAEICVSTSGMMALESGCVAGAAAFGGVGNFDADPNFFDADGTDDLAGTLDDDLRIPHPALGDSPCADAGDNSLIGGAHLELDLAGDTRIQGLHPIILVGSERVEVGAYEIAPLAVVYPGTGDDLRLRVEVDGIPLGMVTTGFLPWEVATDIVPLESGNLVSAKVTSPGGAFAGADALFWLQAFVGGAPPSAPPSLPMIHIDLAQARLNLGPVPATIFDEVVVPPGLVGLQFMMQAVVIHPSIANGVFAATKARELRFL